MLKVDPTKGIPQILHVHDKSTRETRERELLASYLGDLVYAAHTHSPEAAAFIEHAIAALDPKAKSVRNTSVIPLDVLIAALSHAKHDLEPRVGPDIWLVAAISLLNGRDGPRGTG